jgi:hypothetical protein
VLLEKDVRYRAIIKLGFFEKIATNETILDELQEYGFVEVTVWGSDSDRTAEGRWPGDTRDVGLPSQITSVIRIG